MQHDLAGAIVDQALDDVRSERSLVDMVGRALDRLDAGYPSPLWERLRVVDAAGDVVSATAWVRDVAGTHPAPADLSAVWFGLYEGDEQDEDEDESDEAVMTLSGGVTFPDEDWIFEQGWEPPGSVAAPGLRSLAGIASGFEDPALGSLVTYALTFAYAAGLTAEVARGDGGRSLLGERASLGVAVGFHDGDIALLGVLGPAGLDTSAMDWA